MSSVRKMPLFYSMPQLFWAKSASLYRKVGISLLQSRLLFTPKSVSLCCKVGVSLLQSRCLFLPEAFGLFIKTACYVLQSSLFCRVKQAVSQSQTDCLCGFYLLFAKTVAIPPLLGYFAISTHVGGTLVSHNAKNRTVICAYRKNIVN